MKKLLQKILSRCDRHFDQVMVACGSLFFMSMSLYEFHEGNARKAKGLFITALVFGPLALVLLFFWDRLNIFLNKWSYKKSRAPEIFSKVSYEGDVLQYQQESHVVKVSLQDILSVRVITSDEGPFSDDCWVEVMSSQNKMIYPNNARGAEAALYFFEKLPGFDFNKYITAMGSTSNAEFVCWKK